MSDFNYRAVDKQGNIKKGTIDAKDEEAVKNKLKADGLTVVEELAGSDAVDLIVVDSVAAMVPKAEFEAEVGKQTMALQARVLSPFLRKLIGTCAKTGCTVVFINQLRDNVGKSLYMN